jgi:hypothetical protein
MGAPRVLIIAEGPSEIGGLDALAGFSGSARRSPRVREGYIPPILRALLGVEVSIEAQRITNLGRYDAPVRLRGHADRAAKALALAAAAGFSLLVFIKDVDRQPGAKKSDVERKNKLKAMHAEIEAGFADVRSAADVLRVKATPCRMIEAWALGDVEAIATVAGARANRAEVPSRPEELWGAEQNPASGHPKCVLRRALGLASSREMTAAVFEELAEAARPQVLRRTCAESFAPFADETAAAAKALRAALLPPSSSRPGTRPKR